MRKYLNLRANIALGLIFAFLLNTFGTIPICPIACSAEVEEFRLPAPGVMVRLSPEFNPAILKGIKIHPDNPFRFDFILDQGDHPVVDPSSKKAGPLPGGEEARRESIKLIKYFLASLTIPEKDLWVNLSPYEKDRIIPQSFGLTEMGWDLLAEDYMLKQITASLIYPEGETGKKFWKRIYEEAYKKFKTTNIPVNTFNKVWIVPEKAVVFENVKSGTAYIVESKLKVMLEQDYLALGKDSGQPNHPVVGPKVRLPGGEEVNALGSQIIREIVIPELTKEVNEGKNFAQLRQVYNSLILATWYKKKIKDSILEQVYADKNKIKGAEYTNSVIKGGQANHPVVDPASKAAGPLPGGGEVERIYEQYLEAFKKGVYNYIKEEQDPLTHQPTPRKYFSGGFNLMFHNTEFSVGHSFNKAMLNKITKSILVTAVLMGTAINGHAIAQNIPDQTSQAQDMGTIDIEALKAALKSPIQEIYSPAANSLAESDDPRAAIALIDELLKGKNNYLKTTILYLFRDKYAPGIVEATVEVSKDPDPNVREFAAMALYEKNGRPDAVKALLVLSKDRVPKVRIMALKSLGQQDDPRTNAILIDAWQNDQDPKVRLEALKAVAIQDDPEVIDLLSAILENKKSDDEARRIAIDSLTDKYNLKPENYDLKVLNVLFYALKHEPNSGLRESIIYGLRETIEDREHLYHESRMKKNQRVNILRAFATSALKDPDREVRQLAANSWKMSRTDQAQLNTSAYLKAARDRAMASGALVALNTIPPEEFEQVKSEINAIAEKTDTEGTMDPISDDIWEKIRLKDHESGLSQVYRDPQGKVLGFVLAYPDEEKTVDIEKFAVESGSRRLGIGTKLLNALAKRADDEGINELHLGVFKTNNVAQAFYGSMGFRNETPTDAQKYPWIKEAFRYVVSAKELLDNTDTKLKAGEGAMVISDEQLLTMMSDSARNETLLHNALNALNNLVPSLNYEILNEKIPQAQTTLDIIGGQRVKGVFAKLQNFDSSTKKDIETAREIAGELLETLSILEEQRARWELIKLRGSFLEHYESLQKVINNFNKAIQRLNDWLRDIVPGMVEARQRKAEMTAKILPTFFHQFRTWLAPALTLYDMRIESSIDHRKSEMIDQELKQIVAKRNLLGDVAWGDISIQTKALIFEETKIYTQSLTGKLLNLLSGMQGENIIKMINCIRNIQELLVKGWGQSLEKQETNINEIIDTVTYVHPQDIGLTLDLDPNVGNILVDPLYIRDALANLCKNAIEAVEADQAVPKELIVRTKLTDEGQRMTISISDTGKGIDPQDLPRLFDPYFTKGKVGGTGLGLPIAKEIIEQHGGTITVESQLGKGTTFTIHLPVDRAMLRMADGTRIPVPSDDLQMDGARKEEYLRYNRNSEVRGIKQKILDNIEHIPFQRFLEALYHAVDAFNKDNINDKEPYAVMWGLPHSSERWVYELAFPRLAIKPAMTFYYSPAALKRALADGIKHIVITDDAAYSGHGMHGYLMKLPQGVRYSVIVPFMLPYAEDELKAYPSFKFYMTGFLPTMRDILTEQEKIILDQESTDKLEYELHKGRSYFSHKIADEWGLSRSIKNLFTLKDDKYIPYKRPNTAYYKKEEEDVRRQKELDSVMSVTGRKGGIDLTPANKVLQTQDNGVAIKFHIDPAILKQLQNAPGFVPVIISIRPMTDLKAFLLNSTV